MTPKRHAMCLVARPIILCSFIWAVLLSASCSKPLYIDITVVDQNNTPIEGAVITYNKTHIGLSDQNGKLSTHIPNSKPQTLRITAQSPTHHFSPFFKTLSPADLNSSHISYKAILHSLSKQSEPVMVELKNSAKSQTLDLLPAPPPPPSSSPPLPSPSLPSSDVNEKSEIQIDSSENTVMIHDVPDVSPIKNRGLNKKPTEPIDEHLKELHRIAKNSESLKNSADLRISVYERKDRSQQKPLSGVKVFFGYQKSIHLFCVTSSAGHCDMDPTARRGRVITVVLQKPGYISKTHKIQLDHNQHHEFILDAGQSKDIIALSSHYGSPLGVADVTVSAGQTILGQTNSFGYFSTTHSPSKITLRHPLLVPSKQTLTSSSSLSIVGFQYHDPVPLRVALLKPQILARASKSSSSSAMSAIHSSVMNHLFRERLIRRVGETQLKSTTSADFSLQQAAEQGWIHKEMSQWADGFISYYVYPNTRSWRTRGQLVGMIETRIHQSLKGLSQSFIHPVTLPLDNPGRHISKSIRQSLPVQATVLSANSTRITLGVGHHHRIITPHTSGTVWRMSPDLSSPTLMNHKKIAQVLITDIKSHSSVATITSSNMAIQVGDTVVISDRLKTVQTDFMILEHKTATPLANVNFYIENNQVGYTNSSGEVMVSQAYLNIKQPYFMMLPGYEPKQLELILKRSQSLPHKTHPNMPIRTVALRKIHNVIHLDSVPSGLTALIHGQSVGLTPVSVVSPPRPQIHITIMPPHGYKKLSQTIKGTEYDLTGARSLKLERDFIAQYHKLMSQKKPQQAAQVLTFITPHHSDYPTSLELRSEQAKNNHPTQSLLLSYKLAQHLHSFELKPSPSQISNMIEAGLLSFQLASQSDDKKTFHHSVQLYLRSLELLKFSHKHLSSSDPRSIKLNYHINLATHRYALINKDKQLLAKVNQWWREFIGHKPNTESESHRLFSQAVIYAGQAESDLKNF